MKVFKSRGFALAVLVLVIVAGSVYGLSRKPIAVEYGKWIADDAGLLTQETRQTLEETASNRETLHRIKKLMRQKDERANLVFSMRVSGYSYAQIAQKAGISESSARVLEHRIRMWLKEQLEKGGDQ